MRYVAVQCQHLGVEGVEHIGLLQGVWVLQGVRIKEEPDPLPNREWGLKVGLYL